MRIHLIKTCSAFDYKDTLIISNYKSDAKSKGNCIIVHLNGKDLIIPLSNIATIEDYE